MKASRTLFFMLGLFSLIPLGAQSQSLSGALTTVFSQSRWNQSYLGAAQLRELPGMGASLLSDIVYSAKDEALGSFYINLRAIGQLNSPPDEPGNQDAPISLSVSQCYFQVPLGAMALISAGKKNKSIGYAERFNVSNKLTPKGLEAVGKADPAIGMAELDLFLGAHVALEMIGYFSEAEAWEKASLAAGVKLQAEPLNLDIYTYLEKLEYPYLGYNAALQWERVKIYAEGTLASRAQQAALREDPAGIAQDDFSYPEGLSLQQVCGVKIEAGGQGLAFEYLYRSDGPDAAERDRLLDYLGRIGAAASGVDSLGIFYRNQGFDAHYLAFVHDSALVEDLLKSRTSLLLVGGREPSDWDKSLGCQFDYQMRISPTPNLTFDLFLGFSWGAEKSETNLLYPSNLSGGIACTYAFSGK